MPRRRPREPRRAELPASGLLDWTSSTHWSHTPRPCRYCGRETNLRDSARKPAHKTCAEEALRQQAADAAEAYEAARLA
ncbi:hypothetical protein PH213_20615 [Streptomyces sp. SRF1]|uniref:hypothetical protein n=1 Tax=Streptomyces sp. SRF1 TaxID=1549642 RepID=UPI0025AF31CA|nr:hypothetical protein [Streptomyces sp. SRF1]MDN3056910.1 hypothetical protein [Streptomyces sp. SRF1]